jgi:hypothetical protein
MSEAETRAPSAGEEAVEAEIAAHLTTFNRHRKELLGTLRQVHERGPKALSFDGDNAWCRLKFIALIYHRREAELRQEKARMPDAERIKLLLKLEDALSNARRAASKAMKNVGSHWFLEWAQANGNPDLTDPRIYRFEEEFDKTVARLKALEAAAYRAAETVRRRRGRPSGTAAIPHILILNLEGVYRDLTKRRAGAGPGPFARFVKQFLTALGRDCPDGSVVVAIKAAKKREEKSSATRQWGRDLFDGIGVKNLASSQ